MRFRTAHAAGVAAIALALAPASSPAAAVSEAGTTLNVIAAAGETNQISVTSNGTSFVVTDTATNPTAGANCSASGNTATCPLALGANSIVTINAHPGNVAASSNAITIDASVPDYVSSTLTGGAGNDTITGGRGDDTINGGNGGADNLNGGPGLDAISVGAGATATVHGGPGDDTLNGGTGADLLYGDDGNDTFAPGTGNDGVDGGNGDDDLGAAVAADGSDSYTGGGGYDQLGYAAKPTGVSLTEDGAANDGVSGEADNVAGDVERLTGTKFADVIVGGGTDNVIDGGGGSDSLDGGAGNDVVQAVNGSTQQGDDATLHGGPGNDSVRGADGNDQVFGDDGNDVLSGDAGADVLDGGNGVDESYTCCSSGSGVNISLDNIANDGIVGEGDNVHNNVEDVLGTSYADTITGAPGVVNLIDGQGGADAINVASSPADADIVRCTTFEGSPLASVSIDAADLLAGQEQDEGCRIINGRQSTPPPLAPTVSLTKGNVKVGTDGVATVRVRCTRATGRCRGLLQLTSTSGRLLGTSEFVLRAGSSGLFDLLLTPNAKSVLIKGKSIGASLVADVVDSNNLASTTVSKVTLKGTKPKAKKKPAKKKPAKKKSTKKK